MTRGGAPGGRRAGRAGRGGGCLRLMPDQRASRFLDRNCDLDQHRARHGDREPRAAGRNHRAWVPGILRRLLHLRSSPRAPGLQPPPRSLLAAT